MKKTLIAVLAAWTLTGCSSIPFLSSGLKPPSVSGEWVVTRPNYSAFNWTIFEKDNQITGSTSNNTPISGTHNGNRVTLTLTGKTYTVNYDGEVSSDGKIINGTIGGDSTDTFIANKKSSAI